MKTLATLLAIAAFAGLLAWTTLRDSGTSCEVCVDWGGRRHCATVVAPTEEEASERAHRAACGVLGGGMADELACQRTPAGPARCEAR